jgi:hypothetical protein
MIAQFGFWTTYVALPLLTLALFGVAVLLQEYWPYPPKE